MANINEISKLAELLGESNANRLRDAITDRLIRQMDDDLNSFTEYMFDYEEIFAEVKKEVYQLVRTRVMNEYMTTVANSLDEALNAILK